MKTHWLAVLAGTIIGSGCISMGSAQTADTAGKGRLQFAVAPSYARIAAGDGAAELPGIARVDLGVSYGVSDAIDLSGRAGVGRVSVENPGAPMSFFIPTLELGAKFQLTGRDQPGAIVSLAPSVGFLAVGPVSSATFNLPVLVGLPVGAGHQLVLGPRLIGSSYRESFTEAGTEVGVVSAGTSVGFAMRVSDELRVIPEVTAAYPLVAVGPAGASTAEGDAGVLLQFTLGVQFGVGLAAPAPAPAPVPARVPDGG